MNKLIRGIGCFILTCIIFACLVCLTLIFAFGKVDEFGFLTVILILAVFFEFACAVTGMYMYVDFEEPD